MQKKIILISVFLLHVSLFGNDLYFIDAHSQIDHQAKGLSQVLKRMEKNNVKTTLLATRGSRDWLEIIEWNKEHPTKIIPIMRTKGGDYEKSSSKYFERMDEQNKYDAFKGIAEVLLFHNQKGDKAPLVKVKMSDKRFKKVLEIDLQRDWPVVLHIEFASLKGEERTIFMSDMEELLKKYPKHPFMLIHMGQLEHDETRRLINTYPNIYFLTSHSDNITVDKSEQPWINMFEKNDFKKEWRQLLESSPERFIFALDNVWASHWEKDYNEKMNLWSGALSKIDRKSAELIAHGNAQRLWKLNIE